MPKLIAGNWKMNGLGADARREAAALAAGIGAAGDADLLLCPPATLVATLRAALDAAGLGARIAVGGQDCHPAAGGAHTGDVSAAMLADLGCTHVIVGHSERRADHGESDALVRAKAGAAHQAGLVAIVCVGETEAEYRAGETLAVLGRQVGDSLPDAATPANTVIAYEPVWAIGSGLTPTPADIAAAHARIRDAAAIQGIRILYGGSVKPGNAAALLGIAGVDGALVGGASLKAADFLGIAAAAPN